MKTHEPTVLIPLSEYNQLKKFDYNKCQKDIEILNEQICELHKKCILKEISINDFKHEIERLKKKHFWG